MKTKHLLTSIHMEFHLNMGDSTESLYLSTNLEDTDYTQIRLYNPDNLFVGEITHSRFDYKTNLFIDSNRSTINALKHSLVKGEYTLVVDTMSQIDISHPKILTLEWIENPSDELLSTLDFQEVNWFDTSGLILDIHKKHDTDHRYYKGDFHGHTYLSDGAHTIDEAISVLENSSLDFMAFTDHNRLPFGFKDSHKLLIPSFELTMDQGHINLHGIMNADIFGPVHKEVLPKEDLLAYVTERHSQTANISINHMFLDTWQFTSKNYDIRLVNTIEIICDPTYPSCPDANDKAVDFLDFLWNEGHKIYGIGGSDSHNKTNDFYAGAMFPSIYGDPTTHVFCEGLSIDNVLKGIRNGHTYVSRFGLGYFYWSWVLSTG